METAAFYYHVGLLWESNYRTVILGIPQTELSEQQIKLMVFECPCIHPLHIDNQHHFVLLTNSHLQLLDSQLMVE